MKLPILSIFLLSMITCQKVYSSNDVVSKTYVSDGYKKREKGYDWIAVETMRQPHNVLKIKIRSRVDKKKPTCTFDGFAYPVADNQYHIKQGDMMLNLILKTKGIEITPAQETDPNKAMHYCSGGASLIGAYQSVAKLDRTQLDKTKFIQTLSLQNINFFINHKDDSINVRSAGLHYEFNENYSAKGQRITNAEVDDMNRDGYPELLIYLQNTKEPYDGKVLAFSANSNKSLSQISFIPARDNPDLRSYYRGGDEFSLVEHYLVQRFPEYINNKATGRIRQVVYELQNGEASRQSILLKK